MSLLATIRRRALRRGVFGGSRPWLVLGAVAWAIRAVQLAVRPAPERVFVGDLAVGESYVITSRPAPPTRRQRRRGRRAERRAESTATRVRRRSTKHER